MSREKELKQALRRIIKSADIENIRIKEISLPIYWGIRDNFPDKIYDVKISYL